MRDELRDVIRELKANMRARRGGAYDEIEEDEVDDIEGEEALDEELAELGGLEELEEEAPLEEGLAIDDAIASDELASDVDEEPFDRQAMIEFMSKRRKPARQGMSVSIVADPAAQAAAAKPRGRRK